MPFVYMLRCADGTLYTGSAKNLEARIEKHRTGTAARYTRGRRPVALVWFTETLSWSDALRKEYKIKQLTRRQKEDIIASGPSNETKKCEVSKRSCPA